MNENERKSYILALLREREGYAAKGDEDGIAAVDAELGRVGYAAHIERGEQRPRVKVEQRSADI